MFTLAIAIQPIRHGIFDFEMVWDFNYSSGIDRFAKHCNYSDFQCIWHVNEYFASGIENMDWKLNPLQADPINRICSRLKFRFWNLNLSPPSGYIPYFLLYWTGFPWSLLVWSAISFWPKKYFQRSKKWVSGHFFWPYSL